MCLQMCAWYNSLKIHQVLKFNWDLNSKMFITLLLLSKLHKSVYLQKDKLNKMRFQFFLIRKYQNLIVQLLLLLFFNDIFSLTVRNHHNIVYNSLCRTPSIVWDAPKGVYYPFLMLFTIWQMFKYPRRDNDVIKQARIPPTSKFIFHPLSRYRI